MNDILKTMRRIIAILTIASFLAVVTLGFIAMAEHMSHRNCIAALAQQMECPNEQNILTYANYHVNLLKGFSAPVTPAIALTFLNFLAILIAGLIITGLLLKESLFSFFDIKLFRRRERLAQALKHTINYWSALHENSPNFS